VFRLIWHESAKPPAVFQVRNMLEYVDWRKYFYVGTKLIYYGNRIAIIG